MKTLTLSQGTALLYLRRNRGFQSFAASLKPGLNSLALMGLVNYSAETNQAEITADGIAYAYQYL